MAICQSSNRFWLGRSIVLMLLSLSHFSFAQFYDRTWLIGAVQAVKLSFNSGNPDTTSFHTNDAHLWMLRSAADISDTNGNLLFYTNGSEIIDTSSYAMDGGDSILDKLMYSDYSDGIPEAQTALILPRKGDSYYVFYFSQSDSLYATNTIYAPNRFYYAIVDMTQNNGRGKVISKRNVLHKELFGNGRLTACRHSNGRDWWVVHQGYTNNEYYVYLATPDSVYSPKVQTIGVSNFYDANFGSQSGFSPDGSRYFTTTVRGEVSLMHFDRCTGIFYEPDTLMFRASPYTFNGQSVGTVTGMPGGCFSPSGRFLYLNNTYEIWQFDTWAVDVNASAIMVGQWDSISNADFFAMYQMYLMPNGKIIIENIALNTAYHLIDSPEVLGVGCHFRLNGFPVNTLNAVVLPNMINYRLGKLTGSACDTLAATPDYATTQNLIRLRPNPAQSRIEILITTYLPGAVLTICDASGRILFRNEDLYLNQDLDISSWAEGVYFISITSSLGSETHRFVKN